VSLLRVRYFASLADGAGCGCESIEVPAGIDLAGLWRLVVERHPDLARAARPLAACDLAWAPWERRLDGVEEVAFLPPVSGG
jgi:molybdopterin converting factor small subunit